MLYLLVNLIIYFRVFTTLPSILYATYVQNRLFRIRRKNRNFPGNFAVVAIVDDPPLRTAMSTKAASSLYIWDAQQANSQQ